MLDPIKDDLQRVEARLRETPLLDAVEFDLVSEALGQLLGSGGKRMRPALSLLTGRLYPSDHAADHLAGGGGGDAAHGDAGA